MTALNESPLAVVARVVELLPASWESRVVVPFLLS